MGDIIEGKLNLTAKNFPLLAAVQLVATAFFAVVCVYCLQFFRDFAEEAAPIGQRLRNCLLTDLLLAVVAYILKMVVCYDPYALNHGIQNGSFGWLSNDGYITAMVAMIPSQVIAYFLLSGQPFFIQFAANLLTLLLIIWGFKTLGLQDLWSAKKEAKARRLLPGDFMEADEELIELVADSRRVDTRHVIGSGQFGKEFPFRKPSAVNSRTASRWSVTHWSLLKRRQPTDNDNEAESVIKVIDFEQWLICRHSGRPEDMTAKLEKMDNMFVEMTRIWKTVKHINVLRYDDILVSTVTPSTKKFIVSRRADMNLGQFLSKHKPKGVPEDWAHAWFRQLVHGIHYLHSQPVAKLAGIQLAHGSLKPENILLFRRPVAGTGTDARDDYTLKLTDYGFEPIMPFHGRVVTKRDPIVYIGPPVKVHGRSHATRFFMATTTPTEWPYDDVYQLAAVVLILINGDFLHKFVKKPKVDDPSYLESGPDFVTVRMDRPEDRKRLPQMSASVPTRELNKLLDRMMAYQPMLRPKITAVMADKWFVEGPHYEPVGH